MFKICVFIVFWLYFSLTIAAKVTDKEYALMPELFDLDDYDHCMLYEDDALYCRITYELAPLDPKNPSRPWKIIEKVIADPFNYRHDKLRHGVCVTKTCPNVSIRKGNRSEEILKAQLTKCYDEKYAEIGLKGNITEMHCETSDPLYEVDYLDTAVAIIVVLYVSLVIYATFYEGLARYKPQKEYDEIVGTKFGRTMAALSLCKNWCRLKTVKDTQEVRSLKAVQGIRFYNMVLVILCHTVMINSYGPVMNPKYLESTKEKFSTMFLNNGGYAVQTFFLLSAWLLTYNMFLAFGKNGEIKIRHLILAFVHRYLRLTPTLLVVMAFTSTWFRHVSRGPLWDDIVGTAYRHCRKNWWTNILYLNHHIDPEHMCMPHTWYLGVDTQMFILELIIIYIMLKNKKNIPLIIATIAALSVAILFAIVYIMDNEAVLWPYPEYIYRFKMLEFKEWHIILGSVCSNLAGLVVGIGFGYAFYLYKDKKLFRNKLDIAIWWIICLTFPLGIIIIPGLWIYSENFEHNIWFSATYIGFGRLIFAFGIGLTIFGMSQGIGWMAKWICEWSPTYVLGRLTYSAYLVHVSLSFIRAASRRSNVFLQDSLMVCDTISDVFVALVAATLLTLFVEMPSLELIKIILPIKQETSRLDDSKNGVVQAKSKVT